MRRTIALDPNWNERGGGRVKRGADRHYVTASKESILSTVLSSGVWQPDARCCSVWLWATANHLPDALWLMAQLGATYVTNAVWVKASTGEVPQGNLVRKHLDVVDGFRNVHHVQGPGVDVVLPERPGLGQRLRHCHELLLFGRIGKVPTPATADRMPSTIYAPRGRHSEKPQAAYDVIERHDGPGSRLEMYARAQRAGWDAWGDEVAT